ncbi:MAG: VCBS repeat-containing protein [Acidobacteria bacterium]|nr:MAG: VCBS repeat-containing protein [Acidobacteriota bacterium]
MARVEGSYRWLDEARTRVRLPHGMVARVESFDDERIWIRVYESRRIDPPPRQAPGPGDDSGQSPEPLEFLRAGRETDRVRLVPADAGLPQSGLWREGVAIADFDGDGLLDLALPPPRKAVRPQPSIHRQRPAGGWEPWPAARFPPIRYDYGDVAAADLDGDGALDLALGMHVLGVRMLLGDGSGAFRLAAFPPGAAVASKALLVTDWDGDTAPDLVTLGEGMALPDPTAGPPAPRTSTAALRRGVHVWLRDAEAPGGWRRLPFAEGAEPRHEFGGGLVALDYDGDGHTDLAFASHRPSGRGILVRGGGAPRGERLDVLPRRAFTSAVAAADFDRDGRDELLVGLRVRDPREPEQTLTALDLYAFTPAAPGGEGSWRRRSLDSRPGQSGIWSIATADFDGDGALDIAFGTGDGEIALLLADAEGGFVAEASTELTDSSPGCTVRDLRVAFLRPGELHLVALLSGERGQGPTGTASGCASGGRVAVWRIEPAARQ